MPVSYFQFFIGQLLSFSVSAMTAAWASFISDFVGSAIGIEQHVVQSPWCTMENSDLPMPYVRPMWRSNVPSNISRINSGCSCWPFVRNCSNTLDSLAIGHLWMSKIVMGVDNFLFREVPVTLYKTIATLYDPIPRPVSATNGSWLMIVSITPWTKKWWTQLLPLFIVGEGCRHVTHILEVESTLDICIKV